MRVSGTKTALLTVMSTLVATVGLVTTAAPAQAAPPANDDFANAQVLPGLGVYTGTNTDATVEAGEPTRHVADGPADYAPTASVWYRWTSADVPTQPTMQVSTRGSAFDTVLAVYTGADLAHLTEVVGNDDFGAASGPSRVQFTPAQDTTYWIAVDSCCDGTANTSGAIRLRLSTTTGDGSIEGYVTSDGSTGIDGICVVALDDTGEQVSVEGYTDASGYYIIPSVEAGPDRHLKYWNCGSSTYAGEFNGDAQTLAAAPDILVTNGAALTDVDEVLDPGGSISGTVSADDAGNPSSLADICVTATMVGEPDDGFSRQASTDGTGAYTITGLDGGDYQVEFAGTCAPNPEFVSEVYGSLVAVTEGSTTSGIDAGLGAAPGSISGNAHSWETGPGIAGICVRATSSSFTSPSVNTNVNGDYTITNVPAGSGYVVRFSDCNTPTNPLTTQWYNRALKQADADPVTVTSGHTTGGIDASMFHAATLGGQITDENGNPRDPACVNVYKEDDTGTPIDSATTDVDGLWSVQVPPGNYKIEMLDCGGGGLSFETRWYLDATSAGTASIVFVDQGDVKTDLDQVLPGTPGSDGRITGRVTDDTPGQNPLEGICVTATRAGIDTNTTTDAQGRYEFDPLLPGNYVVQFAQCDLDQPYNVLPQYWDDVTSPGAATPVVVSDGTTTSGIVARMHPAGAITGTVTDNGGNPLQSICVTAQLPDGTPVGQDNTDSAGQYEIKGLTTDGYDVSFEDCDYIYVSEWYDNQPFPDGDPTPVLVTEGDTETGIDAQLDRYGTISGTVTNEAGDPLDSMCVVAWNSDGSFGFSAATDVNGDYLVGALGDPNSSTPVQYAVEIFDCSGTYGDEFYDNRLDFDSADLVDVTFGQDTPNIDAVLQDTAPANTTAPEAHGRSAVGVTLRATNGTWSHEPSVFTYQWYRCQSDGSDCQAVDAADQRAYTLTGADEGFRFRVDVTAQNSKGSTTAESALTAVVVAAEAPPNDDIADRQDLSGGLPIEVTGDNVDATREVGEPDHLGFTEGASVWYEWTAPSGPSALDLVSINLAGSTFDTTLSVYDGTPTPFSGLHLVAENDDYDSSTSAVTFAPVAGTTYYIAVDGYPDPSTHAVDMGSIDLRLNTATGVSGTVTDEGGNPIRDICVTATDTPDPVPSGPSVETSADGSYFIDLSPGTWYVDFYDCTGQYEEQWYDGVTDPADATPITVADGTVAGGIDASMVEVVPYGSVSGTVTNEAGDPVPDICVLAVSTDSSSGGIAYTDQNGDYTVRGLGDPSNPTDPVDYIVGFTDCSGFYGDEFYDNKLDPSDADLVPIMLDQDVTGIDAVLQHDAPVNTGSPTVSGPTTAAGTLTAGNGTWDHAPSVFDYQWLRCDNAGVGCTPISGATGPTYTTTDDDSGMTVRVRVTATNSIGSTDADSGPTGIIGRPGVLDRPTVTGASGVGATLTGSNGTWAGHPDTYAYQWSRCDSTGGNCVFIAGEQSTTYVTTASDVGMRLRFRVTATNYLGSTLTQSLPFAVIDAPVNVDKPVVSGPTSIGSTLNATTGTWTRNPTSYAYQWQRCDSAGNNCAAISGAQASAYTIVGGDAGSRIRVRVTATNAAGSNAAQSVATGTVGSPGNLTKPTVSGVLGVGSTLTTTDGTWTGSPTSYSYQWTRCDAAGNNCAFIAGATASTYVTVAADEGARLKSRVTATNAYGSTTSQSVATGVISSPTATVRPVITGSLEVGSTLSTDDGTWLGATGGFAYQWLRCNTGGSACTPISGAQASTYVITVDDAGHRLRVRVTGSSAGGSAVSQSNPTGVVGSPGNVSKPVISGTPQVGSTLSTSDGTWAGGVTSYAYQWLRCDSSGGACAAIGGATGSSYLLASDDLGHRLRVRVTATNAYGGTVSQSNASAVIS